LRSYEDPANKEFLSSIQRGEPPKELIKQANGGEVHLDMQDHRDEDFVPPKNTKPVLYNDGYKLGGDTASAVPTTTSSSDDKAKNEENAKKNLNVDTTKPTTQIQVRLTDGSRLIIKANQTHTVSDLRKYINT
jgi:UBX domain-containing protein 1